MKSLREGITWRYQVLLNDVLKPALIKSRKAISARLKTASKIIDPGFTGTDLSVEDRLKHFFELLQRLSFKPRHVVDIGANHGDWSRLALAHFPDARFSLFEPQPRLEQYMKDLLKEDGRIALHTMGVGSVCGEMLFTLHERDDSCSFAIPGEVARERGFEQVTVPVTTLDHFIGQQKIEPPDLIKIDAEGWDLEVLKGATQTLKNARVVLVEAGVGNTAIPNSMPVVIETLAAHGYRLLDFTDENRTPRKRSLWLVELAFVKVDDELDALTRSYR